MVHPANASDRASVLLPFWPSARDITSLNLSVWNFREDVLGEPGWIASWGGSKHSSPARREDKNNGRITFELPCSPPQPVLDGSRTDNRPRNCGQVLVVHYLRFE